MEKEIAEYLRRLGGGDTVRLDLDDPRYRALALYRRAARSYAGDRKRTVAHIDAGLTRHGWGVTSESRRCITCGPLDGAGHRITLRGAAVGDGGEDAVDPFDAIVKRREEIALAPHRLREAIARRDRDNRKLGNWTRT